MKYVNFQIGNMTHLIPFHDVISRYNYLFVTRKGECLKLAEKIKNNGNNVKVHFLDGLKEGVKFDCVGNWESWKGWADVIVVDDANLKESVKRLKREKYFCIDFNEIKNPDQERLAEKLYKQLEGEVFGRKI